MPTINVTKTFFPPIKEYMAQVQRAYDSGWLTNRGELVIELEKKLTDYLNLQESKILITNNGTIPLQIALKLLGNGGEIITTPFSYVATTAAIVWENCTPVFVDIHPEYLTIDETKIEAAITPRTTCILATHVFGNPCNVEAIEAIAKKHNLKVIYDAAHCFGVKYKGKSIFEYGDISTCSFHATKIFHTGEGGALFINKPAFYQELYLAHAFGHIGDLHYRLGINGKISELQAAMGLAVLPYIEAIIERRSYITDAYYQLLDKQRITTINLRDELVYNYSYFPLIFKDEAQLIRVIEKLKTIDVIPRRYFYPSLNTLTYLKKTTKCIVSEHISTKIICLPLYYELSNQEISFIVQKINIALK